MVRVNDAPWKHNCVSQYSMWPCHVLSRPASDHRVYMCGYEEKLGPNGATHVWTNSHKGCVTPQKPCEGKTAFHITVYDCGVVYNDKEDEVSYVNSSMYETETKVEAAERRVREAEKALAQARYDEKKAQQDLRFRFEPGDGTVLKFKKQYDSSGKLYEFVALRISRSWYLTQSNGFTKSPMSWQELKDFIGDGSAWIFTANRAL